MTLCSLCSCRCFAILQQSESSFVFFPSPSAFGGIRSDGPSSRQFWRTSLCGWLLPRPSSSARICPLTVHSLRLVSVAEVTEWEDTNYILPDLSALSQEHLLTPTFHAVENVSFFPLSVFHAVFIPICRNAASSAHWTIWKETLSAPDVTSINILILNIQLLTH